MPDIENFGLGDYSTAQFIEKIMMQVQENEEEFIFQTIRPYCETIAEMRITKDDLKRAVILLKRQEPVKPIFNKYASSCGSCGEDFVKYFPPNGIEIRFCPFCGTGVKWE